MNLHAPEAIFLVGLLPYIAIRSVYRKRAASVATTVTRSNGADHFLILLVILEQIVLPLVYLFSLWLNLANHASSIVAVGLGAIAWVIGLWTFWRSPMRISARTGRCAWNCAALINSLHEGSTGWSGIPCMQRSF